MDITDPTHETLRELLRQRHAAFERLRGANLLRSLTMWHHSDHRGEECPDGCADARYLADDAAAQALQAQADAEHALGSHVRQRYFETGAASVEEISHAVYVRDLDLAGGLSTLLYRYDPDADL